MIIVPGAWLPEWLLGGEQAKHIIPVVIGLRFEPFMDRRQPCPMVQEFTDGNASLVLRPRNLREKIRSLR